MTEIGTMEDLFPKLCMACLGPLREHRSPAQQVVVCDRLIPPDWRCVTDHDGRLVHVIVPEEYRERAVAIVVEGSVAGRAKFNPFGLHEGAES